jgi:hypothetical protein
MTRGRVLFGLFIFLNAVRSLAGGAVNVADDASASIPIGGTPYCPRPPMSAELNAALKDEVCIVWRANLGTRIQDSQGNRLFNFWSLKKEKNLDVLLKKPFATLATSDQECLLRLVTGDSDCRDESLEQSLAPLGVSPKKIDPLLAGRFFVEAHGTVRGRQLLMQLMRAQDQSGGVFEATLKERLTRESTAPIFSVAGLGPEAKSKIGIGFVNGFVANNSKVGLTLDQMSAALRQEGYQARNLATVTSDDTILNGYRIGMELEKMSQSLDSIILIGLSKGAQEISHALLNPAFVSDRTLKKIKVIISMAGVIRYSKAAEWLIHRTDRIAPNIIQGYLHHTFSPNYPPGLVSLAHDPWTHRRRKPESFSNILWISFAPLPPKFHGLPYDKIGFRKIQKDIYNDVGPVGPIDGVIESAATVLPPNSGMTQWIVPLLASHYIFEGTFTDGTIVSESYRQLEGQDDVLQYRTAAEILFGSILESLPQGRL